jgi:lipopolysaccharide export system protein LptA
MSKKLLVFTLIVIGSFNALAATKGYDSKAPVEITSDTLEIEQDNQQAIFKGNVEAVQSNIEIKSDEMLVHYKSGKNKIGKSENSVSKVETVGNVKLKTPKETASSNKGVFDVDKKIITLLGNVSLQSGKNIVKGEKFVYNLQTGKSRIDSGGKKDTDSTKKKERVRGIFIPGQ